jgi:hypothetical protein
LYPGDTEGMTNQTHITTRDLHHVIAVRDGKPELVHAFLGWHDAQAKWQLLDDERRAAATPVGQLYYIVRSADDPKYTHLAPRLYGSREAAAKALARRLNPGQTSRWQHWLLTDALKCDHRGWWHTANAARRAGYIVVLQNQVSYLTDRVAELVAA